jgi:hypothetical protein
MPSGKISFSKVFMLNVFWTNACQSNVVGPNAFQSIVVQPNVFQPNGTELNGTDLSLFLTKGFQFSISILEKKNFEIKSGSYNNLKLFTPVIISIS